MWSQENKDGLLRHIPQVILFDSFGSSEAVGLGGSVSAAGAAEQTAKFALGPNTRGVHRRRPPRRARLGGDGHGLRRRLHPARLLQGRGEDRVRRSARSRVAAGASPATSPTVNADGSLHLLGRGSVCINTGGEKVFPEEVEEALKTHPGVRDAVVVGLPDPRFGETICAVVEAERGLRRCRSASSAIT